ncbi:MAG TPA: acetyl-CoA C-acetyltransferase, partial [Nitrospiraceae bacterium]|nr:acetyl-CoA C-acetyltransferase [Nitrospiraceae bacterium]
MGDIPVNSKRNVVIVSAARTPLGSFNGIFSPIPATKLGSCAIAEALKRIDLP